MSLLNLDDAPREPLERLAYLADLDRRYAAERDAAWQLAYFEARTQGLGEQAIALRLHSPKRVIAWTRHENERRGRIIKWGDGLA